MANVDIARVLDTGALTGHEVAQFGDSLTDAQVARIVDIIRTGVEHGKAGFFPGTEYGSDADWVYGTGAAIEALEAELEDDWGGVFDVYDDAVHYGHSLASDEVCPEYVLFDRLAERGILVNRDDDYRGLEGATLFAFGVYGLKLVLAFGRVLEDRLENAAAVLPKGYFTTPDLEAAREDMLAYGALTAEVFADRDSDEVADKVWEYATTDLTYTESGYLCSWEWTIIGEGLTRAELLEIASRA